MGICSYNNAVYDHALAHVVGGSSGVISIYNNNVSNWTNWQFPSSTYHQDGIFVWSAQNELLTMYIYNNYLHGGMGSGSASAYIYCGPAQGQAGTGAICYIFNNLIVGSPLLIGFNTPDAANQYLGPYYIYQNTFVTNGTTIIAYTSGSSTGPPSGGLFVETTYLIY